MKLIRTGVFETNSSSCHSLAYVARLQLDKPKETQTITQQFGSLGFTPIFNDQSWEVVFHDYMKAKQTLSTPQDKLWFLLSEVYSDCYLPVVYSSDFYLQVKQWLQNIRIYLEEIGYEKYDLVDNIPTNQTVTMKMFKTADDLYKYLFDNNLVIDIREYEVYTED